MVFAMGVKRKRGFAYMEILLVAAVLAVGIGTAVPAIQTYEGKQRLETAAQQTAGALRQVQQDARNIDAARAERPIFTYSGSRYGISRNLKTSYRYLPKGTSFVSSGQIYFDIDTSGKPVSTKKTVVIQEASTGKQVKVIVQAQSGRIRISWE